MINDRLGDREGRKEKKKVRKRKRWEGETARGREKGGGKIEGISKRQNCDNKEVSFLALWINQKLHTQYCFGHFLHSYSTYLSYYILHIWKSDK